MEETTCRQPQQARLQREYRPDRVRVLFVGEAPPASGRFFYQRDSGLYRAVRDAFTRVDHSISDENFLHRFQAAGCYLLDLCPYPVDRLDRAARRAHRLRNEQILSRAIQKLEPELIVTMLRAIQGNVNRAALRAGWKGRFLPLPYPGRWLRHRNIFIAELVPELQVLAKTGKGISLSTHST